MESVESVLRGWHERKFLKVARRVLACLRDPACQVQGEEFQASSGKDENVKGQNKRRGRYGRLPLFENKKLRATN